jgi:hypothetical protein
MEALFGFLAILVIFFLIISYTALSWGFVLFKFWVWFILPIFTTLPTLNYWQAVGLMLVSSLIVRHTTSIKDEFIDEGKTWFVIVSSPWLTLAAAWVVKSIWL